MSAATEINTLTVNSIMPYRKGEYFWKELSQANTSNPAWVGVSVAASGQTTISGNVFLAKTNEVFAYDLDGNLTSDGRWNYGWDAENRLTSMAANTAYGPQISLKFEYDAKSRRIRKQVWPNATWSNSATNDLRFVYDGWNLIATVNSSLSPLNSFMWGLDLSGSLQGAGGISGLVELNDAANGAYFPAFDGNGNLMGLVKATDGKTSAFYEYGPFGELLRATGIMAKANPFRFSTKYQDDESDLLYYGYRFYSAGLGRWTSRDPSEVRNAVGAYTFITNDPESQSDLLGLWSTDIHKVATRIWLLHNAYTHTASDDVSDADEGVDSGGTSFWPVIGDQRYHFNRTPYTLDSRLLLHANHIKAAKDLCDSRLGADLPFASATSLGIALHPLQDWVAHGDFGIKTSGYITKVHNSDSPQTGLGSVSALPDDWTKDAADSQDGRAAGSAMHYMGDKEWAIFVSGNKRLKMTRDKTREVLVDFHQFIRRYGSCQCKKYFFNEQ